MVRQHFQQYGALSDCVLLTDKTSGRPRGFAFVTFAGGARVAEQVAQGVWLRFLSGLPRAALTPRSAKQRPTRLTAARRVRRARRCGLGSTGWATAAQRLASGTDRARPFRPPTFSAQVDCKMALPRSEQRALPPPMVTVSAVGPRTRKAWSRGVVPPARRPASRTHTHAAVYRRSGAADAGRRVAGGVARAGVATRGATAKPRALTPHPPPPSQPPSAPTSASSASLRTRW